VSGVVLALLLQTSLLPVDQSALTFEFYVVAAFLAGFSERWTKVVLEGAMRTIGDREPLEDATPPPPTTGDVALPGSTATTSTTSTRTTTSTA
jgi:hypothetical protein